MSASERDPRPDQAGEGALEVELDRPLQQELPFGPPTALFCAGSCLHPGARIQALRITVDGQPRTAMRGLPRRGGRTGFWVVIRIPAQTRTGEIALGLEADLEGAGIVRSTLGSIAVVPPPQPVALPGPQAGRAPMIAVCMTTCDPDVRLFRAQIDSLRGQTDRGWICLISDDHSTPERFDAIAATVAGDERFILVRHERRAGFYRNFERVLRMVPPGIDLVGLCDQDDRWYPDRLAALRAAIDGAQLAYSDVRRVDAVGRVRAESLWEGRSNNHTNLASLLISNTIPGAACLMRRHVIERALPFPESSGWDFHDHWLALVALALGDIAYVDRPLYDYVQHPRAVLGRATSEPLAAGAARGVRAWLARRCGVGRWRSAYFTVYLQRKLYAEALLARCERELTARKRRALTLVVGAERSPLGLIWLALRPARTLAGRNETLGEEGVMVQGILWRLVIAIRARFGRRGANDDSGAPAFDPRPVGGRQRRWLTGS